MRRGPVSVSVVSRPDRGIRPARSPSAPTCRSESRAPAPASRAARTQRRPRISATRAGVGIGEPQVRRADRAAAVSDRAPLRLSSLLADRRGAACRPAPRLAGAGPSVRGDALGRLDRAAVEPAARSRPGEPGPSRRSRASAAYDKVWVVHADRPDSGTGPGVLGPRV